MYIDSTIEKEKTFLSRTSFFFISPFGGTTNPKAPKKELRIKKSWHKLSPPPARTICETSCFARHLRRGSTYQAPPSSHVTVASSSSSEPDIFLLLIKILLLILILVLDPDCCYVAGNLSSSPFPVLDRGGSRALSPASPPSETSSYQVPTWSLWWWWRPTMWITGNVKNCTWQLEH